MSVSLVGLTRHRWGRPIVNGHTNASRIWQCRRCSVRARLFGRAWYLVWTEVCVDSTIVWPFAVWTTARPGCSDPYPATRQPRECGSNGITYAKGFP